MTIASGSKIIPPARFAIVGDRQTGKTHAALLYAVNEANAGNRVIMEVRYPNGELHEAQTLAKQLDLDTTHVGTVSGRFGIGFTSGGYINFVQLGHFNRDAVKNQYDVQIVDSDGAHDSNPSREIIGVKRFIAVINTLGTDHIMDAATSRKLMLLGEAVSGQCTAILGEEATNQIIRQIDVIRQQLTDPAVPKPD